MKKTAHRLRVVLDCSFTYLLQRALLGLLALLLPILGAVGLYATYKSLFEYGMGLMELSKVEIIAIVLFMLLERRHSFYCELFGYGAWKKIWRLFAVLGVATVLVLVGVLLVRSYPALIPAWLQQMLWLGTFLVTLYLATPAALLGSAPTTPTEPTEPPSPATHTEAQP